MLNIQASLDTRSSKMAKVQAKINKIEDEVCQYYNGQYISDWDESRMLVKHCVATICTCSHSFTLAPLGVVWLARPPTSTLRGMPAWEKSVPTYMYCGVHSQEHVHVYVPVSSHLLFICPHVEFQSGSLELGCDIVVLSYFELCHMQMTE